MLKYNKQELIDRIDKLSIERIGNTIITKYGSRVIASDNVSNRYEIFDIVSFLKNEIDLIEKSFKIEKYDLIIKGGIQQLKLYSDRVKIGNDEFYKTFFILNSTNRTRKLKINIGLTALNSDFSIVFDNISITKIHTTGISDFVNDHIFETESFDSQINNLKSLVNNKVSLKNVRKIILGDNPKNSDHMKFDSFRKILLKYTIDISSNIYALYRKVLTLDSKRLSDNDFNNTLYIDAYDVLKIYISLFKEMDSHIVEKETSKIMNMTQFVIRNEKLKSIGIL